jgi:hypothetical protein
MTSYDQPPSRLPSEPHTYLVTGAAGFIVMHTSLRLCGDKYAALQGVDALVICTEWQQFSIPDFDEMATRMHSKVIVDGRNLYQPHKLQAEGWTYFSVGRTATSSATTHRMAESH